MLDLDQFVVGPRLVEAHHRHLVVDVGSNLLRGQPASVGTAKLQLIAVVLRPFASQYRFPAVHLHLPQPLEGIVHHPLFFPELPRIGKVLPLTAPTYPEVLTEGVHPFRRPLHKAQGGGKQQLLFLPEGPHVHHIPRGHVFHEYRHPLRRLPHAEALVGQGGDAHTIDAFGKTVFSSSGHGGGCWVGEC